jgi:predicted transcriptional regulator
MAAAIYDARETTVKSAQVSLDKLCKRIDGLRDELGGQFSRSILAIAEETDTSDPVAVRRALRHLMASDKWQKPAAIADRAYKLAFDGIREIEKATYRLETKGVAEAMQEHTPEGVTVEAVYDEKEEELAQDALDWGLPQADRLRAAADELALQLRSKLGLAVLRWGDDVLGGMAKINNSFESSFSDYNRAVFEIGFAGCTWAMRVAMRGVIDSWRSR